MMNSLAHRHRGNLGNRLSLKRVPAHVTVCVSKDVAAEPSIQHLVWMLLNLLVRQADEIAALELLIPPGIPLACRLGPLVPSGVDLVMALRQGVARIHPDVLATPLSPCSSVAIRVGPGPLGDADMALATTADGWAGYVGQIATDVVGRDANPIGAYLAACLCAGEAFKYIRAMEPTAGTFAGCLWVDGFTLHLSESPPTFHAFPTGLFLPATIVAGVGAVGNAFLHTLYAIRGLEGSITLIDHDPEGIDVTNLNRYTLFGPSHIGQAKATAAAALWEKDPLVMYPVNESWQAWRSAHPQDRLPLVISAVDNNPARHAIQDALPQLVLGASTDDMRAQVNLYDPAHGGLCLRCRNPLDAGISDAEVIERLRRLSPKARATAAEDVGIAPTTLDTFLSDPLTHCGMVSGEALQRFHGGAGATQWAVGFASALAGIALAAVYLRYGIDPTAPVLDVQSNTFRFQFWRPDNMLINKVMSTPSEQTCLCRSPIFQRAILQAGAELG